MDDDDLLIRLLTAADRAAARNGWARTTLAAVAREAGAPLGEVRACAPDVAGLFIALAERADAAAAEALDHGGEPEARDRLFDAAMARFDTLLVAKEAIAGFYRFARRDPILLARLAPVRLRTVVSLLEIADVPTVGPTGARRVVELGRVWGKAFDVWLDDDETQSKTMARLDQDLRKRDALWGGGGAYGAEPPKPPPVTPEAEAAP